MNPTDKIINIIRDLKEEGMVANAPGTQGGYGGSSDAEGPTAGFDPVMNNKKRGIKRNGKQYLKLPSGQRKRWKNGYTGIAKSR